jgi:hypothetical protein
MNKATLKVVVNVILVVCVLQGRYKVYTLTKRCNLVQFFFILGDYGGAKILL